MSTEPSGAAGGNFGAYDSSLPGAELNSQMTVSAWSGVDSGVEYTITL